MVRSSVSNDFTRTACGVWWFSFGGGGGGQRIGMGNSYWDFMAYACGVCAGWGNDDADDDAVLCWCDDVEERKRSRRSPLDSHTRSRVTQLINMYAVIYAIVPVSCLLYKLRQWSA